MGAIRAQVEADGACRFPNSTWESWLADAVFVANGTLFPGAVPAPTESEWLTRTCAACQAPLARMRA
jgi:hypothetical protein